MSSRYNPQLFGNEELEKSIVRLKERPSSRKDFAVLQQAVEDLTEQATRNALLAVGEVGQRAVGMMGAYRILSAMLRDADGKKPENIPPEVADALFGELPEDAEDEGDGK